MKKCNIFCVVAVVLFLAGCGSSDSVKNVTASVNISIKKIGATPPTNISAVKADGDVAVCTHDDVDYDAFGAMSKHTEIEKFVMPLLTVELSSTLTEYYTGVNIYDVSENADVIADIDNAGVDLAQGTDAVSDILTTSFETLTTQAVAEAEQVVADCNSIGYDAYTEGMSETDKARFPTCESLNTFEGARFDFLKVFTEFSGVHTELGENTPKTIIIKGSATYTNGETITTYYTKTRTDGMTAADFTTGPAEEMSITAGWFGIEDAKFTTPVAIGSDIQQTVYAAVNLTGVLTVRAAAGGEDGEESSKTVGETIQTGSGAPCVVVEDDHPLGSGQTADLLMCINPPVFSASIGAPNSIKLFQVTDKDYVDVYGYSRLFSTILDSEGNIISTASMDDLNCKTPIGEYGCQMLWPRMDDSYSWTKDATTGNYDMVFGSTIGLQNYLNDFNITLTGDEIASGTWSTESPMEPDSCVTKSSGEWQAMEYTE